MSPRPLARFNWVAAAPAVFVLVWSTGFIVAALRHAACPTVQLSRVALLPLCAWVFCSGFGCLAQLGRVNRAQYLHLCVVGLLMQAGYLGGVWAAVKGGMSAGMSALIVGLQPLLTALWVSRTASGSPASTRQWIGLLLGLLGVTLVVWRKLGVDEANPTSLAWVVLALLSITMGTLYQKRWVKPLDVRAANAVQMAFLRSLSCCHWPGSSAKTHWQWNGELMAAMAWSVLALSLGANSLLVLLIQRGAATKVSSLMYLVPPCTALLAWLLFGEALTLLILLGMVVCAAGVALVIRPAQAGN